MINWREIWIGKTSLSQIWKRKQMYDDVPWDERVGLAGIGYGQSATRDQ